MQIDVNLFRAINNWAHKGNDLNEIMVLFVTWGPSVLSAWLVWFWFSSRKKRKTRFKVLTAVCSFILAEVMYLVSSSFYEQLPPAETLHKVNELITSEMSQLFPNNNSLLFFSVCFILYKTSYSQVRISYLLMIGWLSLARVWVGSEYPSDVLLSIFISWLSATICHKTIYRSKFIKKIVYAYENFEQKIRKKIGKLA
ncbi:phosphatase PAP2 family protein [Vagococcus intermedius]|uniref:Phosphatase PAP2 family protein n=1 Tax=Vagococcus intermedius TaxID=2991418 RepID=A0AAF0CT32_9ENTE|nr:phosphatase PAP2 family protein [Vagococcus intermedius]WEG72428.1 phosphatase PAP2 family protein [Vagococcus intermedius]WEG74515.1 phosphatase PAP2 family protein [Vagococcus intermedius]